MIDNEVLSSILDAKENRAYRQAELIEKYNNSLISFTLNIPGRVKDNETYRAIHMEGLGIIKKRIEENDITILFDQERNNGAGREAFIVVDRDSFSIKKLMVDIEENHPLGRIFDIDVFSNKNEQISRSDLGEDTRRCLLCDLDARLCMRAKNHTYESLIDHIDKLWKDYKEI